MYPKGVLLFGELRVGERFIGFPLSGDDSGHGGYRGTAYVFQKIAGVKNEYGIVNAVRLLDQCLCSYSDDMPVIRVQ